MATNLSDFRVDQALTTSVSLKVVPTFVQDGLPHVFSPSEEAVWWVENLKSVAPGADGGDGGTSSELEFGLRTAAGSYEKVETDGAKRTGTLKQYGVESDLSDDEARLAMRTYGLRRDEVHAQAALQAMLIGRDRNYNAKLVAGTFTNNGARSGIWSSSSTANSYIKRDFEAMAEAILLQSGYGPEACVLDIPYLIAAKMKRSPELNDRDMYLGGQTIKMPDDDFAQYLASYGGWKGVNFMRTAHNSAKRGLTATGARVFTGDDVVCRVDSGNDSGNNGVMWLWTPIGDDPTATPSPGDNPYAIFRGRNPKDEFETFRARMCGLIAVNVELAYLLTAVDA